MNLFIFELLGSDVTDQAAHSKLIPHGRANHFLDQFIPSQANLDTARASMPINHAY